jgi:hypothetical protein
MRVCHTHTHTHTERERETGRDRERERERERLLILSVCALQHKGKKKTGHAMYNLITPKQPGCINSLAQTARERRRK